MHKGHNDVLTILPNSALFGNMKTKSLTMFTMISQVNLV
jgi:hypothetical protein